MEKVFEHQLITLPKISLRKKKKARPERAFFFYSEINVSEG
jgi:hypothetical protein